MCGWETDDNKQMSTIYDCRCNNYYTNTNVCVFVQSSALESDF